MLWRFCVSRRRFAATDAQNDAVPSPHGAAGARADLAALGRLPGRERLRAASRSRVRRRSATPPRCSTSRRCYKYLIGGRDAARLLDRMVTRDVTKCAVGQVLYTPWCDAHGKVIDDGTISRLDEAHVPAHERRAEPALAGDECGRPGGRRSKTSPTRIGALALQGPLSRTILAAAVAGRSRDAQVLPPRPHDRPRHSGHDLAHRLHRRPRLRDLGRRRARGRRCGTR